MKRLFILALILALAACQTDGTTKDEVKKAVTPVMAAHSPQAYLGYQVQWGGTIINTQNLQDATVLEVLAYPLNSRGAPRLGQPAQGRFFVQSRDFLDPADYAPGRAVSVGGTITGNQVGRVGEANFLFPLLESSSIQLYRDLETESVWPRFSIGIGIQKGF